MSQFFKRMILGFRELRMAHRDAKENRAFVGTDRFNNRYYQYYDEEGNETKRICEHHRRLTDDDHDIFWEDWLKYKQAEPPKPEVLKELYAEEEKYRESVFDYEKRDFEMMKKFRKEQAEKAKEENTQTTQTQGFGEQFEPGRWNPGGKNKKD